jgi:long-subunit fatty acid transport protein
MEGTYMKWLINGFCMLLLILMFMADGWAVGVLNTNMSVDYLRTSNRNASTDVDAAFFNPAGLALLPNGLYFNVGNQAIHEKRSITDSSTAIRTYVGRGSDEEYSSSETAWLFPTLNIAYRQDAITVFGSAGPIGGGAKIHYTSGVPVLDAFGIGLGTGVATAYGDTMTGYTRDAEFSGSSVYYGASAGIAYKINEMLSAAIGARYIYVKNHIEGHLRNIVITTPAAERSR